MCRVERERERLLRQERYPISTSSHVRPNQITLIRMDRLVIFSAPGDVRLWVAGGTAFESGVSTFGYGQIATAFADQYVRWDCTDQ